MEIDFTKCTRDEKIIYRIWEAIEVLGKENFYESRNYVILDVTSQYEDKYGNKLTGKYIPTMYRHAEKTSEAMAKRLFSWLQYNFVIPDHGGILLAKSTWETQHCTILTPTDRACSIEW